MTEIALDTNRTELLKRTAPVGRALGAARDLPLRTYVGLQTGLMDRRANGGAERSRASKAFNLGILAADLYFVRMKGLHSPIQKTSDSELPLDHKGRAALWNDDFPD